MQLADEDASYPIYQHGGQTCQWLSNQMSLLRHCALARRSGSDNYPASLSWLAAHLQAPLIRAFQGYKEFFKEGVGFRKPPRTRRS